MPKPGASAVTKSPSFRAHEVRGSSSRKPPEPSQRPAWGATRPEVSLSIVPSHCFDVTMTMTAASGTGLPEGSSTRPVTVIRAGGASSAPARPGAPPSPGA